jgi:hypothetical protein
VKKEYWKNITSYAKKRNNVHIRIVGETKALCGRILNPEFDPNQKDKWQRLDKPTTRRLCQNCKRINNRKVDSRDEKLIKAKKFKKNIIEEPPKEEIDENEFLILEDIYEPKNKTGQKILQLIELEKEIPYIINDLYEEWKNNGVPGNLTFMNQLKKVHQPLSSLASLIKSLKYT